MASCCCGVIEAIEDIMEDSADDEADIPDPAIREWAASEAEDGDLVSGDAV